MLSVLASCPAKAIPRRRKTDTKSDLAVMQQNKFWPNRGAGVNGYIVLLCESPSRRLKMLGSFVLGFVMPSLASAGEK